MTAGKHEVISVIKRINATVLKILQIELWAQ